MTVVYLNTIFTFSVLAFSMLEALFFFLYNSYVSNNHFNHQVSFNFDTFSFIHGLKL